MAAARKKPQTFDVVQVPIGKLKPAEYNPRKASEKEVADVRASLTEFGFVDPLVVNSNPKRKNIVIGGHLRLRVATEMGMTEVPVHYIALDEAKERELNLRLNRNTGSWDWDALAEFDASLLLTVGFTPEELSFNFDLDDEEVGEDEPPAPPADPVSRTGDLWLLGEHRVLCGDSTDPASLAIAMGGGSADCVWTDPPYNVNYEGNSHDVRKGKKRDKISNDSMTSGEFTTFLRKFYEATANAMRSGAPIYVSHSDTNGLTFRQEFASAGFKLSGCLIWNKDNFALGRSDYHWKHEPILYGWKPGAAHTWIGERDKSTVFDCDKPSASPEHPTMKPVALIAQMLRNSAPIGSAVLDPFGGSGSTLMACEELKLKARLVELEPKYVDVIVLRWQNATGKLATLDGGASFAEVAETRKGPASS